MLITMVISDFDFIHVLDAKITFKVTASNCVTNKISTKLQPKFSRLPSHPHWHDLYQKNPFKKLDLAMIWKLVRNCSPLRLLHFKIWISTEIGNFWRLSWRVTQIKMQNKQRFGEDFVKAFVKNSTKTCDKSD